MADILDGQFQNTCWKAFVVLSTEPNPGEATFPLSDLVQAGYNPINQHHYVKLRSGQELKITKGEYEDLLTKLESEPGDEDPADEQPE
ncbi:MAG: hypothetical protein L6Q38_16105 [Nitrospira sp.]|nr:hypothetical protein [Nitrospira sp.]